MLYAWLGLGNIAAYVHGLVSARYWRGLYAAEKAVSDRLKAKCNACRAEIVNVDTWHRT